MVLGYKDTLRKKMDDFVHTVFDLAMNFPKDEIYITTAQLKRSALSVILNYTEGYARFKKKNQLNFLETAYVSLKEAKYLLYFSEKRKFISHEQYTTVIDTVDQIGAMLWTEIIALSKSLDE